MKKSFDEFSIKKDLKDETRLQLYKEILCNSTGQALIKIFYSKSSLFKLFWIACLMSTCSLCAYFIMESLVLYFTPVSSTQVRTHFETMSLFPKVTICNKNALTSKYAFELTNGTTPEEFSSRVNMEFDEAQKGLLQHSLDDILFECQFNLVRNQFIIMGFLKRE